ncbi:hypothetical protein EV363DRAFT_1393136 [Boletus edulis]|uniref:Large ribosomal subunit protein bL32m n=1 Tax=Boletus edulis BED1 TaxID=1328754 RepID=A0AAD4C2B7_BOLED|nr:hypothetical protein EV363DRAFT_1393136 [Boletus edulis]KAF8445975.1 hypothetical protein L210DRAFT_955963 [Boletus edulis BED1]
MAALALHQTRSFFSTFRLPWMRPTSAPAILGSQAPFNLALPILQPLLDLLPAIVLAVPKSKISHSRKSMRSANKGLKDKQNIVNCPACGEAKLAHRACRTCYDTIIANFRQQSKQPSNGTLSNTTKTATRPLS